MNYIFLKLDSSGDGFITMRELKGALTGIISNNVNEEDEAFIKPFI